MKFTIDRQKFLKLLTQVGVAIEPKSPYPVYLTYSLTLDDEGLTVMGTNGSLIIKAFTPYKKGETLIITDYDQGKALVQAKYLLEIAKKLESQTISLEVIDNVIVDVSDSSSKFRLKGMDPSSYPSFDLSLSGQNITLEANTFKNIISQTAFAAANGTVSGVTKQYLYGLNIACNGHTLSFMAADNTRIAKKTIEIAEDCNFSVILPVKAVNEISKMIDGGDITISILEKAVIFSYQDVVLYTRLISGEYELNKRSWNITPKYVLQAPTETLISAIQKATLLAVDTENLVMLVVSDKECRFSSSSSQVGSADITIDNYRYKGDYFEIYINSQLVIDALRACQGEEAVLTFASENSIFKIENPKDPNLTLLTIPAIPNFN